MAMVRRLSWRSTFCSDEQLRPVSPRARYPDLARAHLLYGEWLRPDELRGALRREDHKLDQDN
jgi:hypothetical protein